MKDHQQNKTIKKNKKKKKKKKNNKKTINGNRRGHDNKMEVKSHLIMLAVNEMVLVMNKKEIAHLFK